MNYQQAVELKSKYLPLVIGKPVYQDLDIPVTDIVIKENGNNDYQLLVTAHPNPNLNSKIYQYGLVDFLNNNGIDYDENL